MPNAITLDVGANMSPAERQVAQFVRNLPTVNLKVNVSNAALGKITGEVNEFNKSMAAANARLIAFGSGASVLFTVAAGFRAIVENAIKVQTSLTNINAILGAGSSDLSKFGDKLFDIAKNTGKSFEVVADTAQQFVRQGTSLTETLKRTNDALILARETGLDTADAIKGLTTVYNTYKSTLGDTTTILNKLIAVDTGFAVSAKDLAEGLIRSSQAAKDAKVNFDELAAVITAVQQITQRGGAVIGNSFKSIFTRLQRSETLDQLEALGVGVRNLQGQTVGAVQILSTLAQKYNTLNDAQKAYVSELVGGVYNINVLKAALGDLSNQYGGYSRALNASLNAQDAAIARNKELNKSYEALANSASANFQKITAKVGQLTVGPALKNIFGSFNDIADGINSTQIGANIGAGLLKGIGNYISGPGLALAGAIALKFFGKFASFAAQATQSVLTTTAATEQQQKLTGGINALLQQQKNVYHDIISSGLSRVQQEQAILKLIEAQVAAQAQARNVSESLASTAYQAGYRYSGAGFNKKAGGFIPNFAQSPNAIENLNNFGYLRSNSYAQPLIPHHIRGKTFINEAQKHEAGGFIPNYVSGEEQALARQHGYAPGRVIGYNIQGTDSGLSPSQFINKSGIGKNSVVNTAEYRLTKQGSGAVGIIPPNDAANIDPAKAALLGYRLDKISGGGFVPNFNAADDFLSGGEFDRDSFLEYRKKLRSQYKQETGARAPRSRGASPLFSNQFRQFFDYLPEGESTEGILRNIYGQASRPLSFGADDFVGRYKDDPNFQNLLTVPSNRSFNSFLGDVTGFHQSTIQGQNQSPQAKEFILNEAKNIAALLSTRAGFDEGKVRLNDFQFRLQDYLDRRQGSRGALGAYDLLSKVKGAGIRLSEDPENIKSYLLSGKKYNVAIGGYSKPRAKRRSSGGGGGASRGSREIEHIGDGPNFFTEGKFNQKDLISEAKEIFGLASNYDTYDEAASRLTSFKGKLQNYVDSTSSPTSIFNLIKGIKRTGLVIPDFREDNAASFLQGGGKYNIRAKGFVPNFADTPYEPLSALISNNIDPNIILGVLAGAGIAGGAAIGGGLLHSLFNRGSSGSIKSLEHLQGGNFYNKKILEDLLGDKSIKRRKKSGLVQLGKSFGLDEKYLGSLTKAQLANRLNTEVLQDNPLIYKQLLSQGYVGNDDLKETVGGNADILRSLGLRGRGFVPNFNPLDDALSREASHGKTPIVGSAPDLGISLGVYNTDQQAKYGNLSNTIRADHLGKGQLASSLSLTGSGKESYLPNFADDYLHNQQSEVTQQINQTKQEIQAYTKQQIESQNQLIKANLAGNSIRNDIREQLGVKGNFNASQLSKGLQIGDLNFAKQAAYIADAIPKLGKGGLGSLVNQDKLTATINQVIGEYSKAGISLKESQLAQVQLARAAKNQLDAIVGSTSAEKSKQQATENLVQAEKQQAELFSRLKIQQSRANIDGRIQNVIAQGEGQGLFGSLFGFRGNIYNNAAREIASERGDTLQPGLLGFGLNRKFRENYLRENLSAEQRGALNNLNQRNSDRRLQSLIGGSFIAPIIGSEVGQFLNSNGQNPGGERLASGLGNAAGTFAVAASFGPAGAAIGGVIAGFQAINAISQKFVKSFDDLSKDAEDYKDKQKTNLEAAGNYIEAQQNLIDAIKNGASQLEQNLLKSQVTQSLNDINDPQLRNRLSGAKSLDEQESVLQDVSSQGVSIGAQKSLLADLAGFGDKFNGGNSGTIGGKLSRGYNRVLGYNDALTDDQKQGILGLAQEFIKGGGKADQATRSGLEENLTPQELAEFGKQVASLAPEYGKNAQAIQEVVQKTVLYSKELNALSNNFDKYVQSLNIANDFTTKSLTQRNRFTEQAGGAIAEAFDDKNLKYTLDKTNIANNLQEQNASLSARAVEEILKSVNAFKEDSLGKKSSIAPNDLLDSFSQLNANIRNITAGGGNLDYRKIASAIEGTITNLRGKDTTEGQEGIKYNALITANQGILQSTDAERQLAEKQANFLSQIVDLQRSLNLKLDAAKFNPEDPFKILQILKTSNVDYGFNSGLSGNSISGAIFKGGQAGRRVAAFQEAGISNEALKNGDGTLNQIGELLRKQIARAIYAQLLLTNSGQSSSKLQDIASTGSFRFLQTSPPGSLNAVQAAAQEGNVNPVAASINATLDKQLRPIQQTAQYTQAISDSITDFLSKASGAAGIGENSEKLKALIEQKGNLQGDINSASTSPQVQFYLSAQKNHPKLFPANFSPSSTTSDDVVHFFSLVAQLKQVDSQIKSLSSTGAAASSALANQSLRTTSTLTPASISNLLPSIIREPNTFQGISSNGSINGAIAAGDISQYRLSRNIQASLFQPGEERLRAQDEAQIDYIKSLVANKASLGESQIQISEFDRQLQTINQLHLNGTYNKLDDLNKSLIDTQEIQIKAQKEYAEELQSSGALLTDVQKAYEDTIRSINERRVKEAGLPGTVAALINTNSPTEETRQAFADLAKTQAQRGNLSGALGSLAQSKFYNNPNDKSDILGQVSSEIDSLKEGIGTTFAKIASFQETPRNAIPQLGRELSENYYKQAFNNIFEGVGSLFQGNHSDVSKQLLQQQNVRANVVNLYASSISANGAGSSGSSLGSPSLLLGSPSLRGSQGTDVAGTIINTFADALLSGPGAIAASSRHATGGMVTGGSGAVDDVPTLMSGGEFVIRKSAVNKYGAGFLNSLNSGRVPKFATGGAYGTGNVDIGYGDPNASNFAMSDTQDPYVKRQRYLGNLSLANQFDQGLFNQQVHQYYLQQLLGIGSTALNGITGAAKGAGGFGNLGNILGSQLFGISPTASPVTQSAARGGLIRKFADGGYNDTWSLPSITSGYPYDAGQIDSTQSTAWNPKLAAGLLQLGEGALFGYIGMLNNKRNIINKRREDYFSKLGVSPAKGWYGNGRSIFSDGTNWLGQRIAGAPNDERRLGYLDAGLGLIQNIDSLGANGALGLASGGSVSGGVPNRDSVPALLMGGEYIINKSATNRIGLNTLNQINSGSFNPVRGYSDGGVVTPASQSVSGVSSLPGSQKSSNQANTNNVSINVSVNNSTGGATSTTSSSSSGSGSLSDTKSQEADYKNLSKSVQSIVLDTLAKQSRTRGYLNR